MNALKKTSATLIAFAISASAFAGSDLETRVHELEKKVDMMSTSTPAETFGPKLALSRPEPNGKGWFLTFDVLYWQSKVGGMEYVISDGANVFSPIVHTTNPREAEFDWTFAFKAGIGYKFFHDGWDTHFEYTYFHNNGSDSYAVTKPSALHPLQEQEISLITAVTAADIANSNILKFCEQSSTQLKLSFNDINLDLGRDFFVSKYLSLRPSVGLKASWISLKSSSQYTGGDIRHTFLVGTVSVAEAGLGTNILYANINEKFNGIGPRASLDTKWYLGNDISIYGDLAGALEFGYFRLDSNATFTGQPANSISDTQKIHRLVPTVDFELGLMYEKFMMCDTQHFSISLGYETQYFWDVNYITYTYAPEGIGMYGVNLDLRWDF